MKQSTMIGLALLGAGAWYFYSKSKAAGASSPALATSTGMGGSSLLTPPAPPPNGNFGDPSDPASVAHACNTALTLHLLGHDKEAAYWGNVCVQGGGAVPLSMGARY